MLVPAGVAVVGNPFHREAGPADAPARHHEEKAREGEYRDGTRIVAKASGTSPDPVSVRYTPRSAHPGVFTECLPAEDHRVAVAVNGVPAFEMPCGGLVPPTGEIVLTATPEDYREGVWAVLRR